MKEMQNGDTDRQEITKEQEDLHIFKKISGISISLHSVVPTTQFLYWMESYFFPLQRE